MKVAIKNFAVDMEIKNTGIEIDVYSKDGTKHLGDLIITKTLLIWCKGRKGREAGSKITWEKFMAWAESQEG